jgi:hypothetical protein
MATRDIDPVAALVKAARRTWRAFLKFGPVDDGRPEGDEFDASLTGLKEAAREAKYCPTITVMVRVMPTPGGRGRNAGHWESTTSGGWLQAYRARSYEEAIGKAIRSYYAQGNPPARVVIRQVHTREGR